ncbi:protein of unknown function [Candidatus Hydrogenisulfobacillus filiaventi]|uniref:Uncharacterized protein n=1 Tax=Candidatus Hydrogenisulfobacillus filiaventi TaxID=2707344 RepID=A0A6F8ZGH3_9FIRM|nr:hypothetical protein [Bacillota bacterium]CAB1128987.1 protein of unknown function [Candidatus Hydrogenisulfobacillus filiaventi]
MNPAGVLGVALVLAVAALMWLPVRTGRVAGPGEGRCPRCGGPRAAGAVCSRCGYREGGR